MKSNSKNIKISLIILSVLLCGIKALYSVTTDPESTHSLSRSISRPLQQQNSVNVTLEWKKLTSDTAGFIATTYVLNTRFKTQMYVNFSFAPMFLGVVNLDPKKTGQWGIPSCIKSQGCMTQYIQGKINVHGKWYEEIGAEIPLNFSKVPIPSTGDRAALTLFLMQTLNSTSPYPLGPYGGLSLGPKSPFWYFWTDAYSKGYQYIEFTMTYKAADKSITNIIQAPEGALTGSVLSLTKAAYPLKGEFFLGWSVPSYTFNQSSFGIQTEDKKGYPKYSNYVGTRACVQPEGAYYFAVKDYQAYQQFNKKINMALCGQEKPCNASTDVSKGTKLFIFNNISDTGFGQSSWMPINPESYLVPHGDYIKSMVIQSDDLFASDGDCIGTDFAVGRLFLFEFQVTYNVAFSNDNSRFKLKRVNQMTKGGPLPPNPPPSPSPSPTPKPSTSSSSSSSSSSSQTPSPSPPPKPTPSSSNSSSASSSQKPASSTSSSKSKSSTSFSPSKKSNVWIWILLIVILIVVILVIIFFVVRKCMRMNETLDSEGAILDEEDNDDSDDMERYAKIKT